MLCCVCSERSLHNVCNSGSGSHSLYSPRQPWPTVASCPATVGTSRTTNDCTPVVRVDSMVGAGTTVGRSWDSRSDSRNDNVDSAGHQSRQARCAVSPTGFGASASPAKANRANHERECCTSALQAPSRNKDDMHDRIAMFMMEVRGGNCSHSVNQNRKGPDRICQQCTGVDCKFCVVATFF